MREECSLPKREKCFYSPKHNEEEASLADDYVHMLTDEDIDAVFTAPEIQPFNVSKEAL